MMLPSSLFRSLPATLAAWVIAFIPWLAPAPAADADGISNAIQSLQASIERAKAAVLAGDSDKARAEVAAASRAVEGNLGALPFSIWEVRAQDPNYQPPPLPHTLPLELTETYHRERMNELRTSYDVALESLEEAEKQLGLQKLTQSLQILKSAVDLMRSMLDASTDVKIYNLPQNLYALQQEADENATALIDGFAEIHLARIKVEKIRALKQRVVALFHAHRQQRQTAQSILVEMTRLQAWYPKLLEAVGRAASLPPPVWLQPTTFEAQPFIASLEAVENGIPPLAWAAAESMGLEVDSEAHAAFARVPSPNANDQAEWQRYQDAWEAWQGTLERREHTLTLFEEKAQVWRTSVETFWNALTSTELGPTEWEITSVGEEAWWSASNKSRTPQRWPATWVSNHSSTYPPSAWLRRDLPPTRPTRLAEGLDAFEAYLNALRAWSDGYASEARLGVASLDESSWQTTQRSASTVNAPYAVSPLRTGDFRTVQHNLIGLVTEVWDFHGDVSAATTQAEVLSEHLATIAQAAQACETFIAAHPIELPREETLASTAPALLTQEEESQEARLIDHAYWLTEWTDRVEELRVAPTLLVDQAEAIAAAATELESTIQSDIDFNHELARRSTNLLGLSEEMDAFRSTYFGDGVPSYLYQANRFIDNDLKQLVLPQYAPSPQEQASLETSLRFYVEYVRSVGPQTLSRFTSLIESVSQWTDQLVNVAYEIPQPGGQTVLEAYALPQGSGHLVFADNQAVADSLAQARWSGTPFRQRPEMAASGMLTPDEIALGLPKIHHWLGSRGLPQPEAHLTALDAETFRPLPGGAPEALVVQVTDGDGRPREDTVVTARASHGLPGETSATSDSAGLARLHIGPFAAGTLSADLEILVNGQVKLTLPVIFDRDLDGDGLPSLWESRYGMSDLFDIERGEDEDGDGLDTLSEYRMGTHPWLQDSDADGIPDREEIEAGSDPSEFRSLPQANYSPPLPPLPRIGWDWQLYEESFPIALTSSHLATDGTRAVRVGYALNQEPFPVHRTLTTEDFITYEVEAYETPAFNALHYFNHHFIGLTGKGAWALGEEGWELLADDLPWAEGGYRNEFQSIVFQDQLYLFGGNRWIAGEGNEARSDGWTSSDGIHWERTFESIDWLDNRIDWVLGEWKGKLIAGGGRKADGQIHLGSDYFRDFYQLQTDLSWAADESSLRWPGVGIKGHLHVVGNQLFLIGSVPLGFVGIESQGWFSEDGLSWERMAVERSQLNYDRYWVRGPGGLYSSVMHSGVGPRPEVLREDPVPVTARSTNLATGYFHVLALDREGRLWGWGRKRGFGLGDESLDTVPEPTLLDSEHRWKSVTAAYSISLGVREDGSLWSWGYGAHVLGQEQTSSRSHRTQIGSDTDWAMVSTSGGHCVAVKTDGTLWAWGAGDGYILGQGFEARGVPSAVPLQVGSDTDWVHAQANQGSTAIKEDGSVWHFGFSLNEHHYTPRLLKRYLPIVNTPPVDFTQVVDAHVTQDFAAILQTDGRLYLRGNNEQGELGNGTLEKDIYFRDPDPTTAWVAFSMNVSGTVAAIRYDNTLWTWGPAPGDPAGVPADGAINLEPTQVGSDADWVQIQGSGCWRYFMARKRDGSLWMFGEGDDHVSGNGTKSQRSPLPLPVTPFESPLPETSGNDTDQDGLPDDWERTLAGSLDLTPLQDDDGDGRLNRLEWLQGTDPLDHQSALTLEVQSLPSGDTRLSWPGAAQRTDLLYWSSDLLRWHLLERVAPAPSPTIPEILVVPNGAHFFRLERGLR